MHAADVSLACASRWRTSGNAFALTGANFKWLGDTARSAAGEPCLLSGVRLASLRARFTA